MDGFLNLSKTDHNIFFHQEKSQCSTPRLKALDKWVEPAPSKPREVGLGDDYGCCGCGLNAECVLTT